MRLLFRPFLTVIVTQNTVCEENIHPTSSSSSGEVAEKRLTLYAGTRNKRLEGSFSLPQTRPFSRGHNNTDSSLLAFSSGAWSFCFWALVRGHEEKGHSPMAFCSGISGRNLRSNDLCSDGPCQGSEISLAFCLATLFHTAFVAVC